METCDYGIIVKINNKWQMFGIGCYSEQYAKRIYRVFLKESKILGDVLRIGNEETCNELNRR